MRIRLIIIACALLLAHVAAAQPHTPTRTATWTAAVVATPTPMPTASITPTPAATTTGTKLPGARIKNEFIDWPTAPPTPIATPACILVVRSDNGLAMCIPPAWLGVVGGGGSVSSPFGMTFTLDYREERVHTVAGESSIPTSFQIPGNGTTIFRCLGRTDAAVMLTTGGAPFVGSYTLGMAGARKVHGTIAGTVGATNVADTTFAAPHPNYSAAPVYVTTTGGTFADADGVVTVGCIIGLYTAPNS